MNRFKYLFVGALLLHLLTICFDVGSSYQLAVAPMLLGALGAAGGSVIGGVANSIIGNSQAKSNARYSANLQKELMDYSWNKYNSPKAQAAAYSDAGFNPSVAFGQGGMSAPVAPSNQAPEVSTAPVPFDIGLQDIPNTLLALAQAKKAGAETKNVGVQTEKVLTEIEANRLQNSLVKEFGQKKWSYDVSLAYQNVLLAEKTNDLQEKEKAKKQWEIAKEKALSECSEKERDILQKKLDNTDKELELSNKLLEEKANTERSSQSANYASANAANSQAAVNRENRRLQAALADIEEEGKDAKVKALIAEYEKQGALSASDKKEAEIRLSRLAGTEDKRSTYFFREIDNFLEWLKDKVSIFKSK